MPVGSLGGLPPPPTTTRSRTLRLYHHHHHHHSPPPRRLNRTTTTSTTTTNRNKTAVKIAFDNGFWQRMQPVPRHRWNVVSNTTCVVVVVVVEDNKQTEKEDDAKWHSRAPYVILMGTQKGGSTALAYYLYNHPHIVYLHTKELHFFDELLYYRF